MSSHNLASLTPAERAYALAHTPGMPPPHPGIVPNFVDPYSKAYLIVDVTIVTLVFTTLLVAIRTWTKRFVHKSGLGIEDCEFSICPLLDDVMTMVGDLLMGTFVDLSILAWVSRTDLM